MPNCSETGHKCGVACTDAVNRAYYKDCRTGRIGTGKTYAEARLSATRSVTPKCAGLTGATHDACLRGVSTLFKPPAKIIPPAGFGRPKPKPLQFSVRGGGGAGVTAPRGPSRTVPLGSVTGRGSSGIGAGGHVRTPPIDLRAQPVSTTITEPISTIQDQVANTGMGTWIIIGLAVVVLIMVIK